MDKTLQSLAEQQLTPEQLIDTLPQFNEKIQCFAEDLGLQLGPCVADHIALRVNSLTDAKMLHRLWLEWGDELSNNLINGRPIIVIGLHHPLQVGPWSIDCVELPYPSEKTYPHQGWEHMEWVIPGKAQCADALMTDILRSQPKFSSLWPEGMGRQGITVKQSEPKGKRERLANPTLALKRDGICIKLHSHSLREVIASERP